ncbi:A24 family peptidase [Microbacterium sp. SLBN-146]|uniref:prepilin peptidase n=1 Tax=Microbacterium sp. SLBN-146 TaxID=2768457 RepID=UPI00115164C9|nr:A24 family peptidase [Microbacterium sp. SLBN-146]TQJ32399.1 leader peptidase (prepilin peptidase)/N-methyltransferase [Microbacterium sp. SLBN-146]
MTAADYLLSAVYVLFAALSCVLTVIDIRTHRVPNRLILPSIPLIVALLASACVVGADWRRFGGALLGAVALCCFYLALRLVSPSGMGGGDVKLAGVVGLMLGWWGWSAVALGALASFLSGGLFALAVLLTRRGDRSSRIPFAPFMLGGAWIAVVISVVRLG